jgi:uncharacterized OB-fold protein
MSEEARQSPGNPENEQFWVAAGEGKFLMRYCTLCGKTHWYPRAICPFCFGDTEWRAGSGLGTIYSFSAAGAPDAEAIIAYVQLTEGPMMLTNVVEQASAQTAIGQQVRVVFREVKGRTLPVVVAVRDEARHSGP